MCFETAMRPLRRREGGYARDPDDRGGETYSGISRRFFPGWAGWKIIDSYQSAGILHQLREDTQLFALVDSFYKKHFWDPICGDQLCELSAAVADEVFDSAVNCGRHRASLWLQQALNTLNNGGKRYADITEDGQIGLRTLGALRDYVNTGKPLVVLVHLLNHIQGCHYFRLMRKDPTQEKFAFGWLERT